MSIERSGSYLSCDGKTQISYNIFLPRTVPVAVVRLVYDRLMRAGVQPVDIVMRFAREGK